MKINIRNSVFETNSSSTHIYTFYQEPRLITDKKKNNCYIFESKENKLQALLWLINEIMVFGDAFYVENNDGNQSLYTFYLSDISFQNLTPKFISKLKELTNCNEKSTDNEITQKILEIVVSNEKKLFNQTNYKYFHSGAYLTDIEKITLALRLALLSSDLNYYTDKDYLLSLEQIFFSILEDDIFMDDYKISSYLISGQIMEFKHIKDLSSKICFEQTGKEINDFLFEKGYIGFDHHLMDSYELYAIIDDLEIDCTSYETFKRDFLKIINNDDIVITVN